MTSDAVNNIPATLASKNNFWYPMGTKENVSNEPMTTRAAGRCPIHCVTKAPVMVLGSQ